MKDMPPEIIYLQCCDDWGNYHKSDVAITWSADQINEYDVAYRLDKAEEIMPDKEKES